MAQNIACVLTGQFPCSIPRSAPHVSNRSAIGTVYQLSAT